MMEFTIKRDYFINQLNDTLKAISPRTTLPILTGIKIDAKENEVILTGSDSEISIEITIPKQVDGEEIVEITETARDKAIGGGGDRLFCHGLNLSPPSVLQLLRFFRPRHF